jgi:integrase
MKGCDFNMAERSKRISFDVPNDKINKETIKLFNRYKIDMSIKELSEKTIYNYEKDLFAWFSYIYIFQDNKFIKDITEDDLTEYFYYRKSEGNNSRRMKRVMSSISAMYLYLKKKRQITENPMEFIDRPRKDTDVVVQTFLTQEQVDLMLKKLEELGDLQIQTYIIFGLSTMARVNAMSNLKWEQIDWDNMSANGVLEKEGYIVDLDFDQYCKELLLKLKKEREEKGIDCEYVFISLYNKKYSNVTNSTCNEWCKKIGEMIGVPTLHNHDLRHSGATLMKNNGANLEDISKMLNHKSTDVTLRHYIKEDTTKLKESKAKFGALRNANKEENSL